MTTIVIPEYGFNTVTEAIYQRMPRMVGHPADLATLHRAEDFNVQTGPDTDVLVMVSSDPAPDARRNPGAEALLGFPVFGDAQVSSGDDWIMGDAQIGYVLRKASP